MLKEKGLNAVLHAGLRGGQVAKVAGVAAALSCEGYNLYQEVVQHGEKHKEGNINSDQYQERICESAVTSSSRCVGGLAGAAVGQAAIPVPVVGALIGGLVGAAAGGLQANSMVRGALRLSGSQAKGGDDLVRCVEYTPNASADGDLEEPPKVLKLGGAERGGLEDPPILTGADRGSAATATFDEL